MGEYGRGEQLGREFKIKRPEIYLSFNSPEWGNFRFR